MLRAQDVIPQERQETPVPEQSTSKRAREPSAQHDDDDDDWTARRSPKAPKREPVDDVAEALRVSALFEAVAIH